VHALEQECACIAVAKTTDRQNRESAQGVIVDPRSNRAHQRDSLREQSAGDEREDTSRSVVQPLRVIDEAEKRLPIGSLGQQGQGGEPDQESIRGRPSLMPEHRCQRAALRCREPIKVIQHRRTQLVQAAVGELHFHLDADRGRDVPAGITLRHEVEQGGLAAACLAAKDDDATSTGARVGEDCVEELALGTSPNKCPRPPCPRAPHGCSALRDSLARSLSESDSRPVSGVVRVVGWW